MRLNKILLIIALIIISPAFWGQSLESDNLNVRKSFKKLVIIFKKITPPNSTLN